MTSPLAHAYFDIVKAEKQADGTLMVYGKATDDSLDIDQQICDADWLKEAMPNWFETGGNIREQHSSIAAGVATNLEQKGTAWYVGARIVDPTSVKKVEFDVLKGFSVGIKNPRVIHDEKAANGRIVDGQIVEISLVDRPANPTCQLVLAKSVTGQKTLVKVEEMIEKGSSVKSPAEIIARAKEIAPADIKKFDAGLFETARTALAQLIIVEAQEMVDGHDEEMSLNSLISAVSNLMFWYRGEEAEGETHGELHEGEMKVSKKKDMDAEAEAEAMRKKKESDAEAEADAAAKKKDADADAEAEAEAAKKKDADADAEAEASEKKKEAGTECSCKCAECQIGKGCDAKECKCVTEMAAGMGEQNSGISSEATLEGTTIEAPKSAEENSSLLPADEVEAIVEKAVKSAVDSAMAEAEARFSAKEAEILAKTASLEEELAKTKSLAIAGGPKRTAPAIDATSPNNLLVKAAVARAKANATTDPDLKKGFMIQAEEYTKAADAQLNKSN